MSTFRAAFGATAIAALMAASGAGAQDSTKTKGPTLDETVAWLTTDAAPMLTYTAGPRPGRPGLSRRSILNLRVSECHMGWSDSNALNLNVSTGRAEKTNTVSYTAALADFDVAGIHTKTFSNDDNAIIEFGPRQGRPSIPYRVTSPVQTSDSTRLVGFAVRNEADGQRVVAALKRAALLCGAPTSPF